MGAQRSPNPKLDLRGPHCSRELGKGGKEMVLGKGRKGRIGAMKEGTGAKGKRWALEDFGGPYGPLRYQTLSCSYVYPNSVECRKK